MFTAEGTLFYIMHASGNKICTMLKIMYQNCNKMNTLKIVAKIFVLDIELKIVLVSILYIKKSTLKYIMLFY